MKPINLTISDIEYLNRIKRSLVTAQSLTAEQQAFLVDFLEHIPSSELLLEQLPIPETVEFSAWNMQKLNQSLEDWEELWGNIPGFDFAPNCYILDNDSPELVAQGFVMTALFAPSLAYNMVPSNEAYHVMFKTDGTARFEFPTLEDAREWIY